MKTFAALALALFAAASALARDYSFAVKVVGHGKPLILIPGLTCTGDVWDGTVAELKDKYECHVLTLPGFGKQTPIDGPYLSHVRDDIIAYVKDKKLDHPAVIGHSLGGFMVFYLGIAEPKLFGKMVAVDGLPFLSVIFNPKATADSMKPMAEMIAKQMITSKPAAFQASIKSNLAQEITDPKNVEAMDAFCKDSSPANVAEAMKEMMVTDLRGQVSVIQSPILLLAAGQWAKTDEQKKSLNEIYSSQIQPIPNAKLEVAWTARHFIMLDDPKFFYKAVKDFLASN
ncbi:MAG TPA: alpha/beta hydrolase [Fimbriimonadaceae bacterium]|nr:alpha/beta hydrolase [Fimbriimonadaceae bacterium]